MRVPHFLAEKQVSFETVIHPPAYTASRRARHLHIPGKQVVKAVLLSGPQGYFLAVLPATDQLDLVLLAERLGGAVRLASTDEMRRIFRDCEVGAINPFGSLYGLPSILEQSISANTTIYFESHTHSHAIKMACRDYERLERPRRMTFAIRVQTEGRELATTTLQV
jgi:Ala-tRNA(Pro) deacylase